jgi:alkylhydroperoxidase family enzyme
MARLPYVVVPTDEPDSELARLYAEIAALRGGVHHLQQVLANQPPALRAFMGMSRYVRNQAALDPRLRELAVLATAFALDVAYEQHHHLIAARRVGVTDAQIAALPDWASADVFSPAERAVLAYADQVARTRSVDAATFAEVAAHLATPEIVDLALTVGWYHLCAAILVPLQIEVEE